MSTVASQKLLQIQAKQIRLLYERLTIGLTATSINAVILALILWPRIAHGILIGWLVCIELLALFRYLLLLKYRCNSHLSEERGNWCRRFLLGSTVASGIGWGSAGILLFARDSIAHQSFLAFVLGGMTAGAVTAYSPMMPFFLGFALPALAPITIRLFAEGGDIHSAMGGMALLFLVLMLESGHRMHKTILKTMTLELENEDLIRHLTDETTRAKDLNEELISEIVERQVAQEELKKARDGLEQRVEERTSELRQALENVKVLRGLLPICSLCKKIRNDQGYWTQLEVYIRDHSEAEFSHGLCDACAKKIYPGIDTEQGPVFPGSQPK